MHYILSKFKGKTGLEFTVWLEIEPPSDELLRMKELIRKYIN